VNGAVLDALTRPYPSLVNGTPRSLQFDATTKVFHFSFTTTRPDGRAAPVGLPSAIQVPKRTYPGGYAVHVDGASITSKPCAPVLTLRNRPGAAVVSVRIRPGPCP
jgi:endoglycosylceramidase